MVENVFVLMPAYNAGATVESVFARIPEDVKPRIRRYVAVNDGSKDDTAEALARVQGAFPNLVVLTHEQNRGYGEAEKTLLRYALRGHMPLYKFLANRFLTGIENLAFGMKLAEYHSGYMLYSRKALEAIPFEKLSPSFDFDLEMIVLARVKGLRIAEIAIPTIYAGEKSHLNPIKYGLDVLSIVWAYKRGKYHGMVKARD